jgi:hypothetical protein
VVLAPRALRDESTDDRAGDEELDARRQWSRSVPTEASVKQLVSARSQPGDDVFEVWCRACQGS